MELVPQNISDDAMHIKFMVSTAVHIGKILYASGPDEIEYGENNGERT